MNRRKKMLKFLMDRKHPEKEELKSMTQFCIRKYERRDYDAFCHIFVQVRPEIAPATFQHVLKQSKTHLILLCVFMSVLLFYKSFILSVISIVCFLCLYRLLLFGLIQQEILKFLRQCRMDVDYIQAAGLCFLVADIGGKVGGSATAYPANDADSRTRLTLRRLAVLKEHRGCGIGKALCRAVIDFARQNGYKEVVLESAMVNHIAHTLYERLGFQKIREHKSLTLFGRITDLKLFQFRYKIN